jgi:hypothetical protein
MSTGTALNPEVLGVPDMIVTAGQLKVFVLPGGYDLAGSSSGAGILNLQYQPRSQ